MPVPTHLLCLCLRGNPEIRGVFITKTPPTPLLVLKAAGLSGGSGVPNKTKVGSLTAAQVTEIAKTKLPDLNVNSLEAAESQVRGTCRSMGVTIVD